MTKLQKQKHSHFLAPKYWLTWINIGLIKLMGYSPLALGLGKCLGSLLYHLATRRRHIAEVNLRLCYPELSQAQIAQRIRAAMQNTAIGLFELAIAWSGRLDKHYANTYVKGLEQIFSALAQHKSIILLGCHQTTLDIGLILLGKTLKQQIKKQRANLYASYRVYPNPLFNQYMVRARTRYLKGLISSRDIRAMANCLKKQNTILWIAADQDVSGKGSVYAPFFGIPASTHLSISRLASMTGAAVFSFTSYRKQQAYQLELQQIQAIPSGDLTQDAKTQNQHIQSVINKAPEQYLWMHRRFKTQPDGHNYYTRNK